MAVHGMKRARPDELVPGTASVITARLDYLPRATAARLAAHRVGAPRRSVGGHGLGLCARPRLSQGAAQAPGAARRADRRGDRAFRPPRLHRFGARARGRARVEERHRLARQAHARADRDKGSMFFLGEIFVDVALPRPSRSSDHCGTCSACIDVCPTQAIVAPYQLDARRCISYLTIEAKGAIPVEFRAAIGNRVYGCDDCQLVCPWNKFAQREPARGLRRPAAARRPVAARALGLARGRVPARHRGQRDPPHRLRALAAQPRGRARQRARRERRRGDRRRAARASRRGERARARAHRLGAGPGDARSQCGDPMTPDPSTSAAAIDRFCDAIWIEEGLAANTLAAYRRDLTLLAPGWRGSADDRSSTPARATCVPMRSPATTAARRPAPTGA